METYKIRINCSSKNELTFNNKKINNKIYNDISYALQPETFDYIYKIVIIFEDYYTVENTVEFTNKYLDIICDRCLTDDEYNKLITKLINIGFRCNTYDNDNFNFNYIINNIHNRKNINNYNEYNNRQKNLYIKGV